MHLPEPIGPNEAPFRKNADRIKAMKRLTFIYGAPRTGKSTLSQLIGRNRNTVRISTDLIRDALGARNRYKGFPIEEMYKTPKGYAFDPVDFFFSTQSTESIIEADRVEAHAIWKQLCRLMDRNLQHQKNVVIEGVHLLPELVKKLPYRDTCIVGLVKTNKEKILQGIVSNANNGDWISSFAKKTTTIQISSQVIYEYSNQISQECEKWGIPIFDTSDNFHQNLLRISNEINDHATGCVRSGSRYDGNICRK
jgi:2-phosphoglycerate kinase